MTGGWKQGLREFAVDVAICVTASFVIGFADAAGWGWLTITAIVLTVYKAQAVGFKRGVKAQRSVTKEAWDRFDQNTAPIFEAHRRAKAATDEWRQRRGEDA